MTKPATVFAPSLIVAGNHPEHDAWRAAIEESIRENEKAIARLSDCTGPLPEADTQARSLLNLQNKLHGWLRQSRMPHLVVLNHPLPRNRSGRKPRDAGPRITKRPFVVVVNNKRQYWFGFDDFDDAALFMLKRR